MSLFLSELHCRSLSETGTALTSARQCARKGADPVWGHLLRFLAPQVWCQAVRKDFNPPTILEILDTNYYSHTAEIYRGFISFILCSTRHVVR